MTTTRPTTYARPMAQQAKRHGRQLQWRMTIPGTSEALTARGRYVTVLTAEGVELSFCWPFSPHLRECLGTFTDEGGAQAFAGFREGAR